MNRILLALAVSALSITPALAQGVDAMTCAEFSQQTETEQMGTIAAIQSATSQMQVSQTLMANDIFRQLTTMCSGHDDMMLADIVTEFN
jgi:hypothetical protein